MKRAKKAVAAAVVAACFMLATGGTLAYFTAEEKADNVITSGNVDIELQELRQNEDGSFEQFKDVIGVMPSTSTSKIVQVGNTGFGDAYVRIKIEKAILLSDGVTYASPEEVSKYMGLDFNAEAQKQLDADAWFYNEIDGWWYYIAPDVFGYPGVLTPRATTLPLFSNVTFDPSMPNEFQNAKATITVTVQAVQSAHNPEDSTLGPINVSTGELYAAGWPEPAPSSSEEE